LIISIEDYAVAHGKAVSTMRQRAQRGSFKTAKKIGNSWTIDSAEPLVDHRIKSHDDFVELYKRLGSVHAVARETNFSEAKIKKVLSSCGVYTSERAENIKRLFGAGKSREEIAKILGVKPRTVDTYLPYRKR
jgi:DNA invertase Pin-like site-specific DNA recombinase